MAFSDGRPKRTKQFYQNDSDTPLLPGPYFEQNEALDAENFENGYRSLAGKVVRQEVYAANFEGGLEPHPYQLIAKRFCCQKNPNQNRRTRKPAFLLTRPKP